MKFAFISDIHGNAVALESVLRDLRERNVDELFVLGDICFRGPEPKRSLDLVRSLEMDVIKGNADEWVVRGIRDGEVPTEVRELMDKEQAWTAEQLAREDIDYLQGLPTELNLEFGPMKVHAFHAAPNSLFDVIQPYASDEVIEEKLMVKDADIYVYAHIHKPYIRYINGKCLINTGSVGLPFDGLTQSSYALFELKDNDIQASIVRTNYNVERVIGQFRGSDYPNKELLMGILEKGKV